LSSVTGSKNSCQLVKGLQIKCSKELLAAVFVAMRPWLENWYCFTLCSAPLPWDSTAAGALWF